MLFRRTVTVLPLLFALAAAAAPKPAAIPAYKDGLDAMAAHLWDIAATRFESALTTPELDETGKRTILLRLAETHVRAGRTEAALKVLDDPILATDPALAFWKAQALTTSGRFAEALALLDEKVTVATAPHYREALFTRAALQESLGDPGGALEALNILAKEKDAATVLRAKMNIAAILLEQGKADEALTALPSPNLKMNSQERARSEILRAQAELGKGENQAAIGLFSSVLEKSEDPAYRIYRHEAAAGLAKAQLASGNRSAATDDLLAFIEQERSAPKFGEVFTILLNCLPEPLTTDDAILTRLREWSPPPPLAVPPAGIVGGSGTPSASDVSAVWPAGVATANELGTQALFHLALGLRREGSADSKSSARRLLARLRIEYPGHPLSDRALLEMIRWDLQDNRKEQAQAALAALESSEVPASLRAGASIAAASSAFSTGDFKLAADEIEKASALLEGDALREATLNAAVTRLATGDLAGFEALAEARGKDPRIADDLALERALFLTSVRDPSALGALDRFILDHPQHPRLAEARLAAAHAALDALPPDPAFAKAQIESISAEDAAKLPQADLALAGIRLAEREKRWADAAGLAATFLKQYPADPGANAVRFELGSALFENKDYNDARLALNEVAKTTNSPLAAPALFLAGRASALVGTNQAQEESLAIFDKLIATNGPLADVARLEKARVLITLKRLDGAAAELQPWFDTMKKDAPLRVTTGLLLGDALYPYNSASSDIAKLERALALYEDLLASLPADSSRRFEIEYRRGMVIEELPLTTENSDKALDVYFSVLQAAAKSPPADWQWVDKCGVRARALLETLQKWEAAIGVAQKHGMLPSPGATEARARATALKQEHFIWDK
jgi:outer membrane protein assembly factor BamD (BamD/ComL family)